MTRPGHVALAIETSLPHPWLLPNARKHALQRATKRQQQRETAGLLALEAAQRAGLGTTPAEGPRLERATLRIRWTPNATRRRRPPDPDNALAALKGAIDGLVDAGWLADDRGLTIEPIAFAEPQGFGGVRLELRGAERD